MTLNTLSKLAEEVIKQVNDEFGATSDKFIAKQDQNKAKLRAFELAREKGVSPIYVINVMGMT